MSFTIEKFETRCRTTSAHRNVADLVNRTARERLAPALSEHLGPSLSRLPAVVRIRRVGVRLRMAAGRVNEESFTQAWLQAFGRELFKTLAWPSGTGPIEILRYESEAEYHAAFIRDLLSGEAERSWQYEEFASYFKRSVPELLELVLSENAESCVDTLIELSRMGSLELAVSRMNDLAIERLFRLLGMATPANQSFTVDEFVQIASLTARRHLRAPIDSRQQALYQFVLARQAGLSVAPRVVFQVLTTVAFLARNPGALKSRPALLSAFEEFGDAPGGSRPMIEQLRATAASDPDHPALVELTGAIAALKLVIPGARKPAAVERLVTIDSDVSGLFLLAPLIVRSYELAEVRASKYLMAGLALSVLSRFDPGVASLDPGLALFAGFMAEPDLTGLRRHFAANVDHRAQLERSASQLLLDLASRVRGFRTAPPRAIVTAFIAKPGRIEMNDEAVHVHLAANPYHVALHIAGMDGPSVELDWLGGRLLHIHLEGL